MFFKSDDGKAGPKKRSVPLLPLRDIIVFPHMVSQLFVGRERSINALDAAMARDKDIFLAAQKNAKTNEPTPGRHLHRRHPRHDHAAAPPPGRHREGARRG